MSRLDPANLSASQASSSAAADREAESARVETIDYAKGVGIFLVVTVHVWRGLPFAGVPLPQPAFNAIDRWIYGFHMPLFFFVSGLFLYRSAAKPATTYLREKASTLLWPYLVWATIYFAADALKSRDHALTAASFLHWVLTAPGSLLWFLWVLFAIALAVLVLRKARLPAWGMFVLSVVLCFAVTRPGVQPQIASAVSLPVSKRLFQFAMFFPYVSAAAVLAGPLLAAYRRAPLKLWVTLCVIGAAVVTYATREGVADAQMFNFVSGTAGIVMVLGIARILEHDRLSLFPLIGRYTLEIYLLHILVIGSVRLALSRVGHVTQWWIHLPIGLIAGIAVPIVLAVVCRKLRFPLLFRLPRFAATPSR